MKTLSYNYKNLSDFTDIESTQLKIASFLERQSCKNMLYDYYLMKDLNYVIESNRLENNEEGNNDISKIVSDSNYKILKAIPCLPKSRKKNVDKDTIIVINDHSTKEQITLPKNGHFKAFENMLLEAKKSKKSFSEKAKPMTHEFIMDLNTNIIKNGKDIDYFASYRSPYNYNNVHMTGYTWETTKADKVSDEMDKLLNWYNVKSKNLNPIVRACILHCEVARIQPFIDGNKRTARLLLNFELLRNKLPSIIIYKKEKDEYISLVENAINTHKIMPFVEFVVKKIKQNQKDCREIIAGYKQNKVIEKLL